MFIRHQWDFLSWIRALLEKKGERLRSKPCENHRESKKLPEVQELYLTFFTFLLVIISGDHPLHSAPHSYRSDKIIVFPLMLPAVHLLYCSTMSDRRQTNLLSEGPEVSELMLRNSQKDSDILTPLSNIPTHQPLLQGLTWKKFL